MIINEPELTSDGNVICHNCENEYQRPGYHWSNGSCEYPEIPEDKASLVLGLMLGDGTLRTQTDNPFVQAYMINKRFLEWVDDQLAWLSTGVSMYRTAERSAELSRDSGHSDARAENYHDVYTMQTRTMEQFERYESWYADTERKRIQDGLTFTPTEAKVWFACDGSLNWDRRYPKSRPHATIGVSDEMDDISTVVSMFENSTFGITPRVDDTTIRFSVDETEEFLDWMGDAPPGFEYKWANDSLESYETKKEEALSYPDGDSS